MNMRRYGASTSSSCWGGAKHYATNLSEDHREAAVLASLWDACRIPAGSALILNDDTGPLLHKLWNLVAHDKDGQSKPLSEFLHWAYICQSMRELPEQRTKKEYQLRESGKLTNGQLSFVDC